MTGTPASEMLGKDNYEYALPFYGIRRPILIDLLLNEDLRKEVSYPILKCEDKSRFFAEIFLPHLREGKGAYLWFTASPLYDTDGNISGAIESIRDITDYKMTEGLYQTVFENTGTAMVVVEEDASISHVNEKMKDLLGYSKKDSVDLMKWYDQVFDEDLEKMLEYHSLRRTNSDSVPKSYECRLIHKNGEVKIVTLTAAMIPGTKKSIISIIDITDQKEKEKILRFTQFSVDNAPEGIIWADSNAKFFAANKSAIELYGYTKEELLNMSIPDFAPDFPYDRFLEFWNKAKEKGNLSFETEVIRKNNRSIIIELSVAFLNFEGQDYECGFARDITDRKNAENALKTLNNKLNLLSSVTRHDISNQISVIMGYGELLEMEIDDEKAERYLKPIIEATEKIQNQISFTRAYQEIGVNSPTWQSVDSLLKNSGENISDIDIRINSDAKNVEIYADHMLEKVFYSIFENTVRHGGHATEINISFSEKNGQGILIIEDNGKGVADNIKDKIFERGVGSNTGLGLFLAREILGITGITISETGIEGKGARFEVIVPKSGYRFKD
ncbi:MAG: PAS domain S-box protein [Methanomicrobiaceae archaeon]|nr:PAS domain S-box protein [Methanomicrobiaceae archaeon]